MSANASSPTKENSVELFALMPSGVYHRRTCSYAKDAKNLMSFDDLPSGTRPCDRCDPPDISNRSDVADAAKKAAEEKANQESAAEKAKKAAEEIAEKAKISAQHAEAMLGKKIATVCIRDCIFSGRMWRRDKPGPIFYGEITCPHFRKLSQ